MLNVGKTANDRQNVFSQRKCTQDIPINLAPPNPTTHFGMQTRSWPICFPHLRICEDEARNGNGEPRLNDDYFVGIYYFKLCNFRIGFRKGNQDDLRACIVAVELTVGSVLWRLAYDTPTSPSTAPANGPHRI
ncbi:unnamed protein product [Bursaphelenchus xylophilus]|uniref:(pine wood nematode) hypothetical protein n=1 Tax=Bursaphelenchus xylophilus TaxID=6326 RepID=A0A1I7RRW9_BURXY|nr:unnamed protein product [Bursaphelenchus xylophilus]CAG9123427.1 unnamed protein product [Bursaphelenchus xylophilus]